LSTQHAPRDHAATEGVVGHFSTGGFGPYHRLDCPDAPHRGDPGVRDTIHGPWRYLSSHWAPCALCSPPSDAGESEQDYAAA